MSETAELTRKRVRRKTTGIQYAALPYRENGDRLEVLLVTSRRRRRWIIPKGWPIEGCRPATCAAREALEEAGVSGQMGKVPVGRFRYQKQLRPGVDLPCRVEVFALKVTREHESWAEMDVRERRWCPPAEAAALAGDPELGLLLRKFAHGMASRRRGVNRHPAQRERLSAPSLRRS